jgi:hypothetical protein
MNKGTFASILVFLGGVIAGLLWIMDRQGKRLADSLPAGTYGLVDGLVSAGERFAKYTETDEDDLIFSNLRERLDGPQG